MADLGERRSWLLAFGLLLKSVLARHCLLVCGQLPDKRPLKPQQVWAIRFWLDEQRRLRDRALFDLAIDSKLRRRDVVKIRIGDLASGGGGRIRTRATVVQ